MIWLKQHKIVFVKIPKNASEAIAHHLFTYASSPEDVFTHDNGVQQNLTAPHVTHSHMDVAYILEHDLATVENRFIGVIRNPTERLLSLYLYRCRQNRYETKASPEDFRKRAQRGFIQDHMWQMQLQSTFLIGAEHKDYWLYDNLNAHMSSLAREYQFPDVPLMTINKSVQGVNTKDMISTFYDTTTLRAVHKYWEEDFALYDEVRNAKTRLDYT